MLTLKRGSDTAIIVLHEIYGINQHISGVCEKYHKSGYDVYCPDLLDVAEPFSYFQEEKAYTYFTHNVGFRRSRQIDQLVEQIRLHYKTILLIGFSVGATIGWICAGRGLCDGIVGYYGSRIRDYLTIVPKCPSLLIFADREKSFAPEEVVKTFENTENITAKVLEGCHGFCDPFSKNFCSESAGEAEELTREFLKDLGPAI